MRVRAYISAALALCLALGGGVLIGRWSPPAWTAEITCRPTLPAQAYRETQDPVLLLWGNSLLFDHHWTGTDMAVVNCARQGQTAQAAQARTARLPGPAPDTILLAFGSVEAVRGDTDLAGFETAVAAITAELGARWPEARLLMASVPIFPEMPGAGAITPQSVRALNAILARQAAAAEARFIDLDRTFATLSDSATSYDGVHLTAAAYGAWETAITPR